MVRLIYLLSLSLMYSVTAYDLKHFFHKYYHETDILVFIPIMILFVLIEIMAFAEAMEEYIPKHIRSIFQIFSHLCLIGNSIFWLIYDDYSNTNLALFILAVCGAFFSHYIMHKIEMGRKKGKKK